MGRAAATSPHEGSEDASVTLGHYLAVVRRRLGLILVTALVGAAIAYAGTLLRQPTYRAVALLRLSTPGAVTGGRPQLDYGDRLMNSYAQIVDLGLLDAPLAEAVKSARPPKYGVEPVANTELLLATAEDPDPAVAARGANALAALLQATNVGWMAGGAALGGAPAPGAAPAEGSDAASLGLVEPAVEPPNPVGPGPRIILALGAILGLIGGLGLAFLRESFDATLYDAQTVAAAAGVPVLARVPALPRARRRGSASAVAERATVEEFRRLQLALFGSAHRSAPKAIVVTGTAPEVGASTVVSLLAIATARHGQRVLVVDCDPSAPVQHRTLKPERGALADASARVQAPPNWPPDAEDVRELVVPTDISGLDLLSPSLLSVQASSSFKTVWLAAALAQLRDAYDVILLDATSLRTSADALLLGGQADGALLVVEAGRTDEGALRTAVKRLADCNVRLLGIAVNRAGKG